MGGEGGGTEVSEGEEERMMSRKLLEEGKEEEEEEGRKALPRALLTIRDTIIQEGECSAFKAADALKVELAFITRIT